MPTATCWCCWATATAPSSPTTRPTRPSSWPSPTSPATAPRTSSTPTRGSTAWSSTTAPAIRAVLANQSTGLLDPGAVKLADLNGDGIPDLIVANSGSNNVLIYPGLGNGQFGPAINGGNGYFVGTNPVGITVANLTGPLPDLVVADKGSNQVSILLNQSQTAGAISLRGRPAAEFRRLGAGVHGGGELHRRSLPRHAGHQ